MQNSGLGSSQIRTNTTLTQSCSAAGHFIKITLIFFHEIYDKKVGIHAVIKFCCNLRYYGIFTRGDYQLHLCLKRFCCDFRVPTYRTINRSKLSVIRSTEQNINANSNGNLSIALVDWLILAVFAKKQQKMIVFHSVM